MMARQGSRLSPARLRAFLALLFVAVIVPSAVLIVQTQRQLKWEAFHQYRTLADELGLRIDAELQRMVATEEARSYADYKFVVLAGDPGTSKLLQRSALAQYPVQSALPGLSGYFQIDANGRFSTPLLPDDLSDPARWGLDAAEVAQRVALRDTLLGVLDRNQLLTQRSSLAGVDARLASQANPASTSAAGTLPDAAATQASQAAFDALNTPTQKVQPSPVNRLGRVDDLRLAQNLQRAAAEQLEQRASPSSEQRIKSNAPFRNKRTEQAAVIDGVDAHQAPTTPQARRVRIFESEVDPFEFSLLDDAQAVLYRKVWRSGQRTIQGAIVAQGALVDGVIVKAFEETALAQMSDMAIAYRRDVLRLARSTTESGSVDSAGELQGELLHQLRLSAPFGDFQLLWNINRLPAGPGGRLMLWASAVLLLVLGLGFALLYRLGMKQILLARQQQDFVSAVSHELNTPLTSIRMYAELLDAGWADEDKKREYYRFIHSESERLSRLIANVLQLARMERNELPLDLKPVCVETLMDLLRSTLGQQVARAGFECEYRIAPECAGREALVDADAFVQIVINLVDNALKFSACAQHRLIQIDVRARGAQELAFSVRDHGPGVEKSQLQRIFGLFYRPGSELTRETPGTGIGLALVRQLARAMGGDVEVFNREPGAEFRVLLPAVAKSRPPELPQG